MGKFNKFNIIGYIVIFAAGISLGWFFLPSKDQVIESSSVAENKSEKKVWTCANHPDVLESEPGKCPKCSQDLIPLNEEDLSGDESDTLSISFTKDAAMLADILTSKVTRENPVKEVRLYGKVQVNDNLKKGQKATLSGRIEKMMINSTGEVVTTGQVLALIYSPELVAAQTKLLNAAMNKISQPAAYQNARKKLQQAKLTEAQINDIEKSDRIRNNFEVLSSVSGVVTSRMVNNGQYVKLGEVLYYVSDLSKVWVVFDAYESDLPFLNKGDQVSFTLKSLPGANFTANIVHIDPVINSDTRISKVRVEVDNASEKLKPEMFATGIVQANLSEYRNKLVIPELAVLWTGKRSVVYVKQPGSEDFIFRLREVKLGPMLGNSYVVISGLNEGEEIVSQGAFNVDAAAKLDQKSKNRVESE